MRLLTKTLYAMCKQFKIVPVEGTDIEPVQVKSSKDAEQYIRKFYLNDIEVQESFYLLLLNRANITIAWAKISQGGVCGTVVDPKIVLKYVVDSLAMEVILAHNHPSGNVNPSESDMKITGRIQELLKVMDSSLLDHIILTKVIFSLLY